MAKGSLVTLVRRPAELLLKTGDRVRACKSRQMLNKNGSPFTSLRYLDLVIVRLFPRNFQFFIFSLSRNANKFIQALFRGEPWTVLGRGLRPPLSSPYAAIRFLGTAMASRALAAIICAFVPCSGFIRPTQIGRPVTGKEIELVIVYRVSR